MSGQVQHPVPCSALPHSLQDAEQRLKAALTGGAKKLLCVLTPMGAKGNSFREIRTS